MNKIYTVELTRNVQETVEVEVLSSDADDAIDAAWATANTDRWLEWEQEAVHEYSAEVVNVSGEQQ